MEKISSFLFLFFITISPVLQGLFYPVQYLTFNLIMAGLVLGQVLLGQNLIDFGILKDNIAKLFGLFILSYLIAALLAASKFDAFLILFRYGSLILVCFWGYQLTRRGQINYLLLAIFISAVIEAIFASLTLLDPNIIPGGNKGLRLQGTFQYANTLAIYLTVGFYAGVALYFNAGKNVAKGLIIAGEILILLVVILTFSRGVWMTWLLLTVVFLIILPREQKSLKNLFILLGGLLAVAAIYLAIGSGQVVADRMAAINFGATELKARVAYYLDAIRLFADYPLTGVGGGGWVSRQHQYQTTLYNVQQVHSQPLQVAVESGILGLLAYLAFWVFLIKEFFQQIAKAAVEHKISLVTVLIMVLALGLHSLIDIDLAYQVNLNIIGLLSGVVLGYKYKNYVPKPVRIKWLKGVITGSLLLLMILITPVIISEVQAKTAGDAYRRGDRNLARDKIALALKWNPLDPEYHDISGMVWEDLGRKDQNPILFEKAYLGYREAGRLDPFNPSYLSHQAYLFYRLQRFEESSAAFEKLIELQPLKIVHYENWVLSLVLAGENALKMGDQQKAGFYLRQSFQVISKLNNANKKLSQLNYIARQKPRNLKLTPRLKGYLTLSRQNLKELPKL